MMVPDGSRRGRAALYLAAALGLAVCLKPAAAPLVADTLKGCTRSDLLAARATLHAADGAVSSATYADLVELSSECFERYSPLADPKNAAFSDTEIATDIMLILATRNTNEDRHLLWDILPSFVSSDEQSFVADLQSRPRVEVDLLLEHIIISYRTLALGQ